MALLDSEIARIKYELGYNVLTVGAEPYIGVTQLFAQVIQPYTQSGASTTCATTVTAAASPTLVTLTLTSGTGFAAGARVIVDVDDSQEAAVARTVSGASLTVLLSKAHAGTYPVTVEGGESILRAILGQIQRISGLGSNTGKLQAAAAAVGIKRVNQIEFFGGESGSSASRIEQLESLLTYWRNELATALNVENLRNGGRGGGGNVCAMY